MSDAKRQYKQLIMKGVRDGTPEGRKDVEELQGHIDGLLPRSGGVINGTLGYVAQSKRPETPEKNSFRIYLFKDASGVQSIEVMWDNGSTTTLATHP